MCVCVVKTWEKIGLNFYRYISALYQLIVNERYAEHLQEVSFQHRLRLLFNHRVRSVACHMDQLLRHNVPPENQAAINDLKLKIKSIKYQAIQKHSVIDVDKMAYVVLHTFVDDFLDFCIRFLRQHAAGHGGNGSLNAQ